MVNAMHKDNEDEVNPDKNLIRYEFMEVLVRLAKEKYLKNHLCHDIGEATAMLFEDSKEFFEQIPNEQHWRDEHLWNEKCDTILKYYKT